MPLETVVAAVRVEVGAVQRPRQLGGALGLGLRPIGLFGGSVAGEVGRHTSERSSRWSSATSRHVDTRIATRFGKVLIVSSTEAQTRLTTTPITDDGDHDRFAHLVLEGYTPKDGEYVALGNSVVDGMVNGTPVRALCGKVWVPGRDPSKYSICPTCKEIATSLGWSVPST